MKSTGDRLEVAFDAYWLVNGPPSGSNVLKSMILGWRRAFPDDPMTLVVPHVNDAVHSLSEQTDSEILVVPKTYLFAHGLWVMLGIAKSVRSFDVIVCQNFTPLLFRRQYKVHKMTFVHDALFAERPEWFTFAERMYLRGVAVGVRTANTILTSSDSEARRISRIWPTQSSKVRAVGLAAPLSIQRVQPREPATFESAAVRRPYILAVGRLNVRKNLAALVEAYESSPQLRSTVDLVIVGAKNGKKSGVRASSLPSSVRLLGSVSDEELAWLYKHCLLFVFPSLDEGFGLPMLEARHFGATIVASDIAVFQELHVADAYFDPTSVDQIRSTIEEAVDRSMAGIVVPHRARLTNWIEVVGRIRDAAMEVVN